MLASFRHFKFAFFVFHGFCADGKLVPGGDRAREIAHGVLPLAVGVGDQNVAPGVNFAAVVEQQAGCVQALVPRRVQDAAHIAQAFAGIFKVLPGRQKRAVQGYIRAAQGQVIAGRKAALNVKEGFSHIQKQVGTGAQACVVQLRLGHPKGQIRDGFRLGFFRQFHVLQVQPHASALYQGVQKGELPAGEHDVAPARNG